MDNNPFQTREPSILGNPLLRAPQREAYAELAAFAGDPDEQEREVGIVLPVGCGKSGCITIAPFAVRAIRALVVVPGVKIAERLHDDFDPARSAASWTASPTRNPPKSEAPRPIGSIMKKRTWF